jgi:alanine dehydrogenase
MVCSSAITRPRRTPVMDTHPADPTIGFPRESGTERRTILTPGLARALIRAGFEVIAEAGVGSGAFIGDEEYAAVGVRLTEPAQVWSAPLILRYKSPDSADLQHLRPEQHIAALFHAEGDAGLLTALQYCGATAWSYEFVAEDGRFPLGRPGGQIAGIQGVFAGAHALQASSGRGVLLAAADGAAKANVVVIGSGNVGSAAAQTAAALGANVTVLTRSEPSRADYLQRAPGGVQVLVNTRERRWSAWPRRT